MESTTQSLVNTFPSEDAHWVSTAEFVESYRKGKEPLIAPRRFADRLDGLQPYTKKLKSARDFKWAIVHKGSLDKINSQLLDSIVHEFHPVFANEVFVVFSKHSDLPELDAAHPHWAALRRQLHLDEETKPTGKFFKLKFLNLEIDLRIKRQPDTDSPSLDVLKAESKIVQSKLTASEIEPVDAPASIQVGDEVLEETARSDAPVELAADAAPEESIATPEVAQATDEPVDYATLSTDEIKVLMDQRFGANEAYPMICVWDQIRADELNQCVIKLITPTDNQRILEIGCGVGGSAPYVDTCKEFIGTDLSEAAIAVANQTYGDRPNFKFMSMNAEKLDFGDNEFDLFLAKEVIEHIPDAQACLREAFRVLKPGGKIVLTSPNRDSLHLRINRKLGYADFKCSIDHVKEFTFQEALEMVQQQGFTVQETGGVFLTPYWGIPGVDAPVRYFTDHDLEVVNLMRDLGRRVGGDYAFCFVISAVKPST